VVGCGIAERSLEIASPYYSEVFQFDIEQSRLDERFDYVVFLEVLEHLFKPKSVLEQCHGLLKMMEFSWTASQTSRGKSIE
jgi:2-polyprenyl-3-methyl-5-hydroxy-6-metoxy-1,4-benzoquinol methylase